MHTVSLDGHNFTLPEGFTIELAAGPPLASRPVAIDFDERGRMYVTEMDGAITKPDIQAQKKLHRVLRLADIDGDGRFDNSTVFADQLAFPEGIMWRQGSVYVGAPPQIWKLTDTNDDGVADRREVWFDGQTITGCANDLHGPYLGPDGWIYWNKGAFAKQEYTLPTGKHFSSRASHIFRARPDGTGIEPVMTGGMDNPVDTVFTPGGERIFSTTFFQRPAGGLRDGLIHAIYGGIYGKDQDAIYDPDHKWTSPELMPVLVHHGPSAPCGLHRLESSQLGIDYQDNVFSCQFNLRKVSRHVLVASGSTFITRDHDFLVSDNTDFHPTDVIEDADGSLLVVNTGGWYKLCCPSSQLVKEDVLGAIYRVRRIGVPPIIDPRGRMIDWGKLTAADMAARLGKSPVAVRRQLIERLAEQGPAAVGPLNSILANSDSGSNAALAAISAASRIYGAEARAAIRQAFTFKGDLVRQAAIHAASVWRDKAAVPQLATILASTSRQNRRAAAEALGRIGDPAAVPAILTALADPQNDRALDHSLTYALIEIGNEESLRPAVAAQDARVQRAVLVALDQIGATLDPQLILAALDSPDSALRQSALWIASRHSEWGQELTAYLDKMLAKAAEPAEQDQAIDLLARLSRSTAVQELLANAARRSFHAPAAAHVALAAMAASGQKELTGTWLSAVLNVLETNSPAIGDALIVLKAVPPAKSDAEKVVAALIKVGESSAPAELRLSALAAVPGGLKSVSAGQLDLLLAHIDREQPTASRGLAADVLSRAKLTPPQLLTLIETLPRANPLDLDRLLGAFAQSTDEAVGLKLLAALTAPELRSSLTVDSVQQRLTKYGPAVQAEAEQLYAAINAEHAAQSAHLKQVLAALPPGDIRRGQTIFNSAKTSCRACHTIGYVGGRIGPDLTRIGQIRQQRDLLESVLYPSASFVRSYEPLAVRTLDGQVHSGIVKINTPSELVLTLAADKEIHLTPGDIEIMQPGKVSIMPAGLEKQLTLQELADLVEFLRNCK